MLPSRAARFTRREQLHLTLRFLGEVNEAALPQLTASLQAACADSPAPELLAERVGVFPALRNPRVVWAWVHDDAGRLLALQKKVESAVGAFAGEPPEKEFTGHVTLARIDRVKRPQAEALAAWVNGMTGRRFGSWTGGEVRLMRSELGRGGAVHSALAVAPLK